jgi:hypothetical protein
MPGSNHVRAASLHRSSSAPSGAPARIRCNASAGSAGAGRAGPGTLRGARRRTALPGRLGLPDRSDATPLWPHRHGVAAPPPCHPSIPPAACRASTLRRRQRSAEPRVVRAASDAAVMSSTIGMAGRSAARTEGPPQPRCRAVRSPRAARARAAWGTARGAPSGTRRRWTRCRPAVGGSAWRGASRPHGNSGVLGTAY